MVATTVGRRCLSALALLALAALFLMPAAAGEKRSA
jgi:hypothetical protein